MDSTDSLTAGVLDEHRLTELVAHHASHARLCTRLEAIADRLPERPRGEEARELCETLARYQAEQQEYLPVLQSALMAVDTGQPLVHTLTDHVRGRRNATVATADDLIAAFDPERPGERRLCAEALGFMLRSFFDTCRHVLAIEEIAILLVAGDRLTPGARGLLESRLAMMR